MHLGSDALVRAIDLCEDAEAVSGVMRRAIAQTNAADYPPDVIAKLLARHGPADVTAMLGKREMFCAVEGEEIVGTVALEDEQLRSLFVEPSRQGEGLGGMLVSHLEAHALVRGRTSLWLQSSITAKAFYTRRGWVVERFVEQDDGSVTIMRKRF